MTRPGLTSQCQELHGARDPAERGACSGWQRALMLRWWRQGLTLVHYSAQLEPFLTQKHTLSTCGIPYYPLNTPETTPNCTPVTQKALKLS